MMREENVSLECEEAGSGEMLKWEQEWDAQRVNSWKRKPTH